MAYLEDILPKIRKGRKARRPMWHKDLFITGKNLAFRLGDGDVITHPLTHDDIATDDWEVVPEPTRVADYFVITQPSVSTFPEVVTGRKWYTIQTHPIGSQPEGSVMVPGSERNATK